MARQTDVQTVAFGSALTGIGLTIDLQRGLVDRFRSLPMAPPSAPSSPAGR